MAGGQARITRYVIAGRLQVRESENALMLRYIKYVSSLLGGMKSEGGMLKHWHLHLPFICIVIYLYIEKLPRQNMITSCSLGCLSS